MIRDSRSEGMAASIRVDGGSGREWRWWLMTSMVFADSKRRFPVMRK